MNEGAIITEEMQVKALIDQLERMTAKKAFYQQQIQFINSHDFNFVKDFDMNIKKLSGRIAHISRNQSILRARIKVFNPTFELTK